MAAFTAFAVAAVTIVILMFGLAIVIGTAQVRTVSKMRTSPQQVKRLGGTILILVGIWLVILSVWARSFVRLFPV